jgi:uncharacterized protein DUF4430
VLRRTLVVLATLVVALSVVSLAAAAVVHVRVEGKTQTIFGGTEPNVAGTNALEVLLNAARAAEFFAHVTTTSFGPYVDQIGYYPAVGQTGWVFKVNGASPPVGADQVTLADGDVVLWYWAEFGPAGGPPTLELQRLPRNCYAVTKRADSGARSSAAGAVLHVDGRRVKTNAGGRGCVGRHVGLVKALLPGAVRSNAVR